MSLHTSQRHPFPFRGVKSILIMVACCLLSQGCSDLLKQPFPAKSYFGIDAGSPDSTARIGSTTAPSTHPIGCPGMLVRAVRVSPPYDGLAFVYRTGPAQYSTDYYVNWIASPSSLLTGDLINWLVTTSPLPIVPTGSTVRPDYVLETEVTRLMIDRTDPAKPRANIQARFFLTHPDATGTTVVLDQSDSAEVVAAPDTPAGDAAACGQAYRQLLQRLTATLPTNLRSTPSTQ